MLPALKSEGLLGEGRTATPEAILKIEGGGDALLARRSLGRYIPINLGDISPMRNIIAWLLIVLGLIAAIGGAGMIVIGLMTRHSDVALAGSGWTVVGAMLTFGGVRLRMVPTKTHRHGIERPH
jgi:hypothetical protein